MKLLATFAYMVLMFLRPPVHFVLQILAKIALIATIAVWFFDEKAPFSARLSFGVVCIVAVVLSYAYDKLLMCLSDDNTIFEQ